MEPTSGHGKYASAKVGQQGGPIFADGRGRRGRRVVVVAVAVAPVWRSGATCLAKKWFRVPLLR